MEYWPCIFDSATNRGKRCFGEPREGEFLVSVHQSMCFWFNVFPSRYMWNGSNIVEWPGWELEESANNCIKDLSEAKRRKTELIMEEFIAETKKPVSIGSLKFDGGWSSLDKLDRAIQFAKKLGITERTFYETDETPHVLPVSGDGVSGDNILLAIAIDYDAKDAKMREMVKAVNDATDINAVNNVSIDWS